MNAKPIRILLTGANGFIGSHLLRALLDAGHEVVACVRNPDAFRRRWPGVAAVAADFAGDHRPEVWLPRMQGIDLVINAVGIISESGAQTFEALHHQAPIALFHACEQCGVRRVIQISALGAGAEAISRYHLSKYQADRYLRASGLDWAVLMPSIVYGPGAKSMALFKAMASLPVVPLIGRGDQRIQPIHVDDLSRAVLELVDSPEEIRADIEMVGPEPLTMRELYARLHHWLGLGQARFLGMPYALALLGARLSSLFISSPLTPENLQMLQKSNTADVAPFEARFGFRPHSVERALVETPAQQADQWHAGLYLLRPALRLSIAFLWLFSGLVSAFVYPLEQSMALLGQVGVPATWQPILLYGAAALDMLLGMAVFFPVATNRPVASGRHAALQPDHHPGPAGAVVPPLWSRQQKPAADGGDPGHVDIGKEGVMEYLLLKWIHILSSVLLFGTGLGSAFYKWTADRSVDLNAIAHTNRIVVIADWWFTTPTVLIQPISGFWLLHLLGLPLETAWIIAATALYLLAGACWLPVVRLQIRMRDLSAEALNSGTSLGAHYHRYARIWFWLGIPAFIAMLLVYGLMVFKSQFAPWGTAL